MRLIWPFALVAVSFLSAGLSRLAGETPGSEIAGDENIHWPEFRGPRGDGHAPAAKLPLEFSESKNVRWKTAVHGRAWSSPVIWKDQVWLTTATEDGRDLSAVCLDKETGAVLQDFVVFHIAQPQFCYPMNSYASPTPALEEGRAYLHYGSHGTAGIDTTNGAVLWTRQDLPCDHHRGAASSPVLSGDLLFIHYDGFDQQYVVALDKHSGDTVWKQDRAIDYGTTDGDAKKAYCTPALWTAGGETQLISPSAGATISYSPLTGDELWRVRHGGMNVAARPLFGNGMAYISTGDGGFRLYAVRPDGRGDVTETHVVWQQAESVPSRCSLLLAGELLFMINEAGILTCLDALDGKEIWKHRLGGDYSASPVMAGGRMYFFSQEGDCPVVAAEREFKLLAKNTLDEGCLASPAISGDALFVRTRTHVYRLQAGE